MQGVEKKGSLPPDRDIVTTEKGNVEKVELEQKHLEEGEFSISVNSAPARASGERQELRQGGWPADGRGAEAEAEARGDAEDSGGPGDQDRKQITEELDGASRSTISRALTERPRRPLQTSSSLRSAPGL